MERRSLESFTLVARLGSMSAAAERLSLTQPAVSKQIKRLETDLGVQLFHRTPSGLSLTAAGRTLLEMGRDVLTHFDRAEAIMEARFRGRPTFRVACPHSTALGLITPFMAATDPPIADLEILPADDLDAALNGEVDLAIGSVPPPRHRAQVTVAEIPVTAQASPERAPWPDGASHLNLEDAGDACLIVSRTGVKLVVIEATSHLRFSQPIRDASTAAVAQALAANGHGLAIVTEPPRFGLRALPAHANGRPLTSPLYASWDMNHYGSRELYDLAARLRRWLPLTLAP